MSDHDITRAKMLLRLSEAGVDVADETFAEATDRLAKRSWHDGRKDLTTGRFHSMTLPRRTVVPGTGIPITHQDTREHLALDLLGGKREPGDDGNLPVTPYDNEPGDGAGRTHESAARWMFPPA